MLDQLRSEVVLQFLLLEYTHGMGVNFYAMYDAGGEGSKVKEILEVELKGWGRVGWGCRCHVGEVTF